MVPEEGRSAIAAAARAIADLRLGRLDDETTANVGVITGGSARNIIPEWCELEAEARSHDARKLADLVQEMLDTFAFAASVTECMVETEVSETSRATVQGERSDRPFLQPPRSRRVATRWCRLSPAAVRMRTSSNQGLPCLNLANGMAEIHTAEEHIAVDDLDAMVDVTLALVDAARDATQP